MAKFWDCAANISSETDADYGAPIFDGWHNDRYLVQCYNNLQEKYDCGAIQDDEWKRIDDFITERSDELL